MSIIVIINSDTRKQQFVAELQRQTGGAVALVIVEERPRMSWRQRSERWRTCSVRQLLGELYYALRLRMSSAKRHDLQVFHTSAGDTSSPIGWAAPVLRVSSVNDPKVKVAIEQYEPAVVAVWGSGMLTTDTIAAAPVALNIHLGISTKYRGAYANQRAVELGDWTNIGATIHHINEQADAGAVIQTIHATLLRTPEATFSALHNQVATAFINTLTAILAGETPPGVVPDLAHSENLRLANWTPARRWRVAEQLTHWPVHNSD